jgi:hypothetical protein
MHISSPYCGRYQPPTCASRNLEDHRLAVPQQDLQSLTVNYCRAGVCSTEAYSADKLLFISTEEQFTANIAAPDTNPSIEQLGSRFRARFSLTEAGRAHARRQSSPVALSIVTWVGAGRPTGVFVPRPILMRSIRVGLRPPPRVASTDMELTGPISPLHRTNRICKLQRSKFLSPEDSNTEVD